MKRSPLLLTVTFVVALVFVIDRWLVDTWHKKMNSELEAATTLYQQRLENAVAIRLNGVESLVALFIMHPDTQLDEFEKFSQHIMGTNKTIRTLQYADSTTLITYTFPRKGNEVLIEKPLTLITDPKRGPYVEKAISQRTASVQGPFKLREGGTGIVVRSPIFSGESFLGLAIGVYDIDKLVEDAFAGINLKRLSFRLQNSNNEIFYGVEREFEGVEIRKVLVADTIWTITVGWAKRSISTPIWNRLLVWGCGLALLLSVLLFTQKSAAQNILLEMEVEERTKKIVEANQALSREIVDRKEIEEKLRKSEERYDIAMSASQDGLYDWNLVTNEIYYSPSWKKMLGYSDHELPNKFSSWETLTNPEDVAKAWEMQQKLISRELPRFEMEFKMKHRDGHWVDILSRAKATFNDNDEAVRIIGTHVDISERKKSENALKESEEMFRALFEQAGGYCMILDPNTPDGIPLIVDANDAACAAHGYSKEEFIGRPVADIDDEEGKRLVKERTQEILTGKPFYVENTHVRKDGSTFPVEVNANRIEVEGGGPLILTTEYDITSRRELEDKLRQAQKMEAIGTLAGGIAHDFNNILTSVIGFTELSFEFAEDESELRDNLDEIYTAGQRAKVLINQILMFSRQNDDELGIIEPKLIIQEALGLLRSTIPTTIDIQHSLESEASIQGNAIQMHQVMMNMCTNAAHSMEGDGGTLKIELFEQKLTDRELQGGNISSGEYLVLRVTDTGTGIPSDILEYIFEPYYTTKEQGKGTGLGLSMVYGIVNRHEGFIDVQSEVGQGTTFTIYLPMSRRINEGQVEQGRDLELGNEHILVVDDESQIAKLTKKMLIGLGYSVTSETSPVKAYEILSNDPLKFDLVISDVTMPELPGHKLALNLKKVRDNIPIILCTGYSEIIDQQNMKEYGVNALIKKPLLKTDLARTVRDVLDSSAETGST